MLECNPVAGRPECTVCKTCASVCPVKVDLDLVIPQYRYLFRPDTSHRGVFEAVGKMMTYSKMKGWLAGVETDESSDVVYFPGCAPLFDLLLDRDTNYSGGAKAAVLVLNKMGVKPRVMYACCGHDQYYGGMLDEFDAMKKNLAGEFGSMAGKTIVTGCAECYHMLKNHHKASNVVFFTDYVLKNKDKLKLDAKKDLKTAYHDPCRLGRHNEVYSSPRELLNLISTFSEMAKIKELATCCGVSSWVNCNFESRKIRIERLKEAKAAGADYLVTTCPKCRVHLDCVHFDKIEKTDVPDVKIIDVQELIGLAAGVYDPASKEPSYVVNEVKTDAPKAPVEKHDPARHLTDEVMKNIYTCTTCARCTEECHSGVPTAEEVLSFRRALYTMGKLPNVHKMALDNIKTLGNPFGEQADRRKDVLDGIELTPGAEVLLFTGCVPGLQDLKLVPALAEILKAANVKFQAQGPGETCCGFLAHLAGAEDAFQAAIDRNVAKFAATGAKVILTPCPGCFRTFSHLYPERANFPFKVVHTTEFIAQLIKDGKLKLTGEQAVHVAYHDPCDLGRHCGIYDAPRDIIKAVPGATLVEFAANREKANCCGAGGGTKGFANETSLDVGYRRTKEAQDVGADIIVSACGSCKDNLGLGASRIKKEGGPKLKVMDLVEFVAKSL